MFTAALILAKTSKQSIYSRMGVKSVAYSLNSIPYPGITNDLLLHKTTWINLTKFMLSESHQKTKYIECSHFCKVQKQTKLVYSVKSENSGYLGGGTVTKEGSDGLGGCWACSVSCFGWLHKCAHFVKIHQAIHVRLARFSVYVSHLNKFI